MLNSFKYPCLIKNKKSKISLSVLVLFSFFLLGFWGKSNAIETNVTKTKVKTGETFTYNITVNDNLSNGTLFLPEFDDFNIVSQSQSESYTIKGGKEVVSLRLSYLLFAPHPGTFTINGPILEDNGRQFKGIPITIEVKGQTLREKKKILPYIEEGIDL